MSISENINVCAFKTTAKLTTATYDCVLPRATQGRPKSEIYTPKRDDEHRSVSLLYGSTPGTNCMGLSEEHHPFPRILFSISPSQDYLKLSLSARKKKSKAKTKALTYVLMYSVDLILSQNI